jgi:Protein of unknown function (DUF2637)
LTRHPTSSHRGLRLLALCAVTLGLLLLAAAAFVLSYAGVHAVALSAGVSPRLARIYPLILDAMVVVAGAAVLSLRGAGLPSRWYAWLSLLVMLAADAGADTVHAVGAKLQQKPTAAAAAIIPWALVLIGFGLLLTMLRHARLRLDVRREPAAQPENAVPDAKPVSVRVLTPETRPVPQSVYPVAQPAAETEPRPQAEADPAAGENLTGQPAGPGEPESEYEFRPEDEFEPDDDDSEFEPDDELEPELEPEDDDEDEDDIEDDARSGAEPDAPETGSGSGTAGSFERVRSTPLPPGG